MASETDVRIARAVALKAAVDMYIAAGTRNGDPRILANEYVKWLLDIAASDGDCDLTRHRSGTRCSCGLADALKAAGL